MKTLGGWGRETLEPIEAIGHLQIQAKAAGLPES